MFTKNKERLINKYKLVSGYKKKSLSVMAYPSIINIETSFLCNLDCPMCSRELEMEKRFGNMGLNLYKKIIDEINRYTELAVLHNAGEPLMNNNIVEMVDYAKFNKMNTMFSTNAMLLTDELAKGLIKSGLSRIIMAMDGATKKTYEDIRKGADFEKVEENILSFIKLKKKLGKRIPHIIIQFIEMKSNKHEVKQFIEKWSKHDVHIFIKPSTAWGKDIGHKHTIHCDRLWFQNVILADGTVIPCCQDLKVEFSPGNINDSSFFDLWNSVKMEKIRESNIDEPNEFKLCKDCNYNPPRKHNILTGIAQCVFDMSTLTLLLYKLGYKKKSQL